jgi:type I restriction enzyme S subunit
MVVETLKHASISIDEVMASKLRFEANVFNIDVRNSNVLLKNCKWDVINICGINGLCTAYRPNIATRIYVKKSEGVPLLTPSQMNELKPVANKFLSLTTKTDLSKWYVKNGQILLSCSGTIGNSTIVTKYLDNALFSQNLIQLTAKNSNDIGYIYTYIISKIGQNLIKGNLYGAVIKHIDPEHLENVPIPNPSNEIKEKIHNLIMTSFDLRDQANELIDQAEKLLVDALKLPSFDTLQPNYYDKKSEVKTFSVKLDLLNNRFDGSYHNPVVMNIIDCFLDNAESIETLSDLCSDINMPGIFKRNYVSKEDGVPFLGTNDILQLSPNVEKFLSKTTHKTLIEKQLSVKENTILITDRGTIGNVALVPEYYEKEKWTVSQNSIRLVPNSNDIAGYIYIFLNSEYGKALSKRETYGAVIDMIDPNNARQIPIPILKQKEVMQEINELALKANKLRAKAYYKEQDALQILNDEVIYATK